MRKESTKFAAIYNFVDRLVLGETFTRGDLVASLSKDSEHYVDTTRYNLCSAGYIKKVKFGVHKKIKEFPEGFNSLQLFIEAHGCSPRAYSKKE